MKVMMLEISYYHLKNLLTNLGIITNLIITNNNEKCVIYSKNDNIEIFIHIETQVEIHKE